MNRAVFLDRDGVMNEVLNERVKYVNQPNEFHLLPGVGEAIHHMNQAGWKVFVVTNQGGVGLGFMKEETLRRIHEKMKQDLKQFHAHIDDIAYCPHKPKAGCPCRKPKPKMILDLAEQYQITLVGSIMIGDREPDIEAGKRAGTKTIFIGKQEENTAHADKVFPDLISAVPWILSLPS